MNVSYQPLRSMSSREAKPCKKKNNNKTNKQTLESDQRQGALLPPSKAWDQERALPIACGSVVIIKFFFFFIKKKRGGFIIKLLVNYELTRATCNWLLTIIGTALRN